MKSKWRERKKTKSNSSFRKHKIFAFSLAFIMFLASFTTIFVILLPDKVEAADYWLGITGWEFDSGCHIGGDAGHTIEEALNGTDYWGCGNTLPHYFVVDLGLKYNITKVRGRSNRGNDFEMEDQQDPIFVNIYVGNTSITEAEGPAVKEGIETWANTNNWVVIDTTDKIGRYIRVEIMHTEDPTGALGFGATGDPPASPFRIFDAYGTPEDGGDVVYNFSSFHGGYGTWENFPDLMVDEDNSTNASTTVPNDTQRLLNTTTKSSTPVGTITKVQIRCMGHDSGGDYDITLTPIFTGGDGDPHVFDAPSGTNGWSEWFDITTDTNSPGFGVSGVDAAAQDSWSWEDITNLELEVESGGTMPPIDVYCSIVQVRVTYIIDLSAKFTTSFSVIDTGQSVSFDASGSQKAVNWTWDFNNDSTPDGYGEQTSYTFKKAGIYTVNLTIRDSQEPQGAEYAYMDDTVTVKQKISLVKNVNNNGVNYLTWGANSSIMASKLADDLGLGSGAYISKFNHSSGNWSNLTYEVDTGIKNFKIQRWDHILIHITDNRSHSFLPDTGCSDSQNVEMDFTEKNNGYYYITWNQDYNIDPSDFLTNLGGIGGGEDITLRVYNSTTNVWKKYYNKLPSIFSDLSVIRPYDVVSFKAPEDRANITYNPDGW